MFGAKFKIFKWIIVAANYIFEWKLFDENENVTEGIWQKWDRISYTIFWLCTYNGDSLLSTCLKEDADKCHLGHQVYLGQSHM